MIKLVSMTPAVFHLPEAVNAVTRSYGRAPIVPRGPRLQPLLDGVRRGIVGALGAEGYEAVMLTGTGSTAMAAVLGSCLHSDERLLVVRNGAYGDRLLDFARRLEQPFVDLAHDYGERPDLAQVEALCRDGEIDAVAMVYGGTSTCTLNPVAELGAITKRYEKKLFIDGVSALFVEPFEFDNWGISAVMGSCNKGLHSHPNLTCAIVRRELMEEMGGIPQRIPSLELYDIWRKQSAGAHPYTIDPLSLCQVQAALQALAEEGGVSGRHAIYRARCELLRAGYEALGLRIARWANMPLSSIGTALHIPAGKSYDELANRLASEPIEGHAFEIYSAQGKLSGELFRVFHMGCYDLATYELFLRALERALS